MELQADSLAGMASSYRSTRLLFILVCLEYGQTCPVRAWSGSCPNAQEQPPMRTDRSQSSSAAVPHWAHGSRLQPAAAAKNAGPSIPGM